MIHPSVALKRINDIIGFGVVAQQKIPAGTITWVQDPLDQVLGDADIERLNPLLHATLDRFTFRNPQGQFVLCWDIARYMNHSCDPTCMGTEFGFEVAVRDIEAGEELTVDYASFLMLQGDEFACLCNSRLCRGQIRMSDRHQMVPVWTNRFHAAIPFIPANDQPLLPLLAPEVLNSIRQSAYHTRPA